MHKTSVFTLVNGNIKELAHRKQQKSQKVIVFSSTLTDVDDCALRLHQRWSFHALCVLPLATAPSSDCCIGLEQSAGVSPVIAVVASFPLQTENRTFCPVLRT